MKYALAFSAAVLLGAGLFQPAFGESPADLVKNAVDAQGGADALRALKGAVIKAEAKHWEPGQSYSATGEPRFLGTSTITLTADAENRVARIDWDRDMKYPAAEHLKFSEIVAPSFGVVIDAQGEQAMSGIRLASQQREIGRASPLLMLRALDNPQNVSAMPDQKAGERSLPAISYSAGATKFVIMFDRDSKLPAVIRTRDDDHIYGDSDYDLILSDWKPVGGVKLAHTLSYRLNGTEVQHVTYQEVAPNPTIPAETFAVGDDVKAKAKAAATDAPYQWVLRRMFLGRFTDSDNVYYPDNGGFKIVELAPNVLQVVGGSANNLIVAMQDGIVVFDAPVDDGQSRWVIDQAKARFPGKPIKYLVLTHHHMDHTGGMRAYVAEGASVIVPAPDKSYFEQVVQTSHSLAPDMLQKQGKPATIVEVKDQMSLKDDSVEIRLYNIPNPHVDGMLIGHVVTQNVVWVTDLWSPGRDTKRTPGIVAVNEAVKRLGIANATFAGGHGTNAKQSALDGILAQN